jgi:hypothetical protein
LTMRWTTQTSVGTPFVSITHKTATRSTGFQWRSSRRFRGIFSFNRSFMKAQPSSRYLSKQPSPWSSIAWTDTMGPTLCTGKLELGRHILWGC